ncbi:MAG: hypothetical protein B7X59_04305 [Polaromonas sp. 39-63-203]|nr:MAG: hypothetical protein B7Y54_04290 [Polaromonas sp. 35-63-240]OYZ84132.1 MAG: hypothetical protein B7Y03_05485 [Polaromonas sp. 24-62-144]OZA99098.1 MAG: hypothetical protein B7X59_04305 [Polaromonas sp. 39-63-203]
MDLNDEAAKRRRGAEPGRLKGKVSRWWTGGALSGGTSGFAETGRASRVAAVHSDVSQRASEGNGELLTICMLIS